MTSQNLKDNFHHSGDSHVEHFLEHPFNHSHHYSSSLAPPTPEEIHQANAERRHHPPEIQHEHPHHHKKSSGAIEGPEGHYESGDSDLSADEHEPAVDESEGKDRETNAHRISSSSPSGGHINIHRKQNSLPVSSGSGYAWGDRGNGGYSGWGKGHRKKTLVLCFDGTGNRFKGNDGDTNILKIFSMLDRRGHDGTRQYHYYQPGIGTYLTTAAMTHKSAQGIYDRVAHFYHKGMDAAVGHSFDQHVVGGYRFLMRYYRPGDDIYMFGFSRGAYTARFLAEMLDHVGLVVPGNEEMVHFAWKTFSNWQQRRNEKTKKGKKQKEEMYDYMKAFRETFARPVKRVRFLGLFDTVNSVKRFESAWLRRGGRFAYTTRSTARIIRHAVGIDERRAKFRLDLVEKADMDELADTMRKKSKMRSWIAEKTDIKDGIVKGPVKALSAKLRRDSKVNQSENNSAAIQATPSLVSLHILFEKEEGDDDEAEQDVQEVWFPGCHGDIGGGWDLAPGEPALSYGPLIWMIREARKAGLAFDERRLKEMGCWTELDVPAETKVTTNTHAESHDHAEFNVPTIQLTTAISPTNVSTKSNFHHSNIKDSNGSTNSPQEKSTFPVTVSKVPTIPGTPPSLQTEIDSATSGRLLDAFTKGRIHDLLCFNNGISHVGVMGWKLMEYLPFRRMDLRPDGSWKAIWWPLPRGEVRDIPDGALVHVSALKRMEADEEYRPGNLIIGGGGRGVRKAPKERGTGKWVVYSEKGSLVGEVYVKRESKKGRMIMGETVEDRASENGLKDKKE